MSTAYTVVIPARYASTRLPGKPLQDIAGKPMIRHVWEQARKSAAQRVVIATDDQRIVNACTAFGAEVVLTRAEHNSGTDRLAEVAEQLGLPGDAIVVNVQGDEPMIPPAVIDRSPPIWRTIRRLPSLRWPNLWRMLRRCSIPMLSRCSGYQRPGADLQPSAAALGA